jgi:hypothetical protein
MVSSAARRIKLSVNMRPFLSRVVRNGWVQRAFKEQIGRPVGGCVRSGVHKGMSGAQIHEVARNCAKQVSGSHLARPTGIAPRIAADSIGVSNVLALDTVLNDTDLGLENLI